MTLRDSEDAAYHTAMIHHHLAELQDNLRHAMELAGRVGETYAMNNLRCAIDCTDKIGIRLAQVAEKSESFR